MKVNNILSVISIFVALLLITAGCSAPGASLEDSSFISMKITGLPNGDITVNMSEVVLLKSYEGKVEGADSEGNPVVFNIRGGYFSDLLQKSGYSQTDLAGIRIIAADGYSIEVSREILKARDIIIAYEIDGKPLDKDNAPFRVFIPGERAMYWVRMVYEINVLSSVNSGAVTGINIIESMYSSADYQDYEFEGRSYKALDTKRIIADYPSIRGEVVIMMAADGLIKNETLENFYKGVISMTGKDSPKFLSSSLPEGMFVRNLVVFKYGGNAFYFAVSRKTRSLDDLAQTCGLAAADSYTVMFAEGTAQHIASSELPKWTMGIRNGKVYAQKQGQEQQYINPISININ